jgi:hypothetical protein
MGWGSVRQSPNYQPKEKKTIQILRLEEQKGGVVYEVQELIPPSRRWNYSGPVQKAGTLKELTMGDGATDGTCLDERCHESCHLEHRDREKEI